MKREDRREQVGEKAEGIIMKNPFSQFSMV